MARKSYYIPPSPFILSHFLYLQTSNTSSLSPHTAEDIASYSPEKIQAIRELLHTTVTTNSYVSQHRTHILRLLVTIWTAHAHSESHVPVLTFSRLSHFFVPSYIIKLVLEMPLIISYDPLIFNLTYFNCCSIFHCRYIILYL